MNAASEKTWLRFVFRANCAGFHFNFSVTFSTGVSTHAMSSNLQCSYSKNAVLEVCVLVQVTTMLSFDLFAG